MPCEFFQGSPEKAIIKLSNYFEVSFHFGFTAVVILLLLLLLLLSEIENSLYHNQESEEKKISVIL